MLCITRVIGSDPSLVDSCLAGEPLLALPVKHGSTLYLLILGKPFKIRRKSTLITKNAWYALRLWPFDFYWIARYNSRWGTKELYEFVCLWTTLFGPYWGNMDKGAGEDHSVNHHQRKNSTLQYFQIRSIQASWKKFLHYEVLQTPCW